MHNKILSLFRRLSAFWAISLILGGSMVIVPNTAHATGTTAIDTCTEFQNIKNNLSGNYILTDDINCAESAEWSEAFDTMGTVGTPFTGTLDGQGYTVSGIMISGIESYAGIFVATSSTAVIENIGFTDVNITGGVYTAGIVGYHQGTIQNVFTTGTITNFGDSYAGGFVGYNRGGDIIDSYSKATVSASNYYAGGLVGYNNSSSTVVRSYATGTITSGSPGGLVGYNGGGTITDSFWDTQTTGASTSSGGSTGKTTTQMKTESTFTNWDFDNTWAIDSLLNNGYPYLQIESPYVSTITSSTADGLYGEGDQIDIDVTFSEAVTSDGNITVTLETGNTDRTCTFTVNNSTSGSCTYTIQAGDATDDLTVNSVSGSLEDADWYPLWNTTPLTNLNENKTLIIETTAPTVTIDSDEVPHSDRTSENAITVQFEMSEAVSGFTKDDITVDNATLTNFTEVSSTSYTVVAKPIASGYVTLRVPAGSVEDIAGNANTISNMYEVRYRPLIDRVSRDGGTLTIKFTNGTSKSVTPFNGNIDFQYNISPDNSTLIVTNGLLLKLYIQGDLQSSEKINTEKPEQDLYTMKVKRLYKGYTTIVVATPEKMSVLRLTSKHKLKKKRTVTFSNSIDAAPEIQFAKKKKHIELLFSDSTQLTWKLLKKGKLKPIE